ncbi:DUF7388 family protein [Natronorarus salvus]|uniref:DUF7388 family protein n=1 Tax=Natronorarus salvus TaxID=3117733 RepID=UPI002F264C9A
MLRTERSVSETGLDAVALKPAGCDVRRATELSLSSVVIDYEGRANLPDRETLSDLAGSLDLRVTTPVRADGFDPLGPADLVDRIPEEARRVLVAGHPAYLTEGERKKAIAPRLGAAVESTPDAWVGTEGIERLALATGATQFELLSRATERDVRGVRAAGFDGEIAVYAPTVIAEELDTVLDAVGGYVARRGPVVRALPEGAATDANASGRAREVLAAASGDYALCGTETEIRARVDRLREAGVDTVVGYPAAGIEAFIAK